MTDVDAPIVLAKARVAALLEGLERMAAGDTQKRLPLSPLGDELDAIAYGINVLGDELRWTSARMSETERRIADDLRQSKERAERANEAKSVFLRTASHEIRTPIAAILGIADVLAFGELTDEEYFDLIDRLRANSRSLQSLIGNVLDLSRLEADKLALVVEQVSPPELAREVVRSLESDIRKKQLDVRVENALPASFVVHTDRARLRQILVNLMANAVKFTASGAIRIWLRLQRIDGRNSLTIDIADSGIGIATNQRPYLFEPFGQADPTITRLHGGTGLGLALSRRLAERLDGTLELLHSEPGRGSTFRLTLAAPALDSSVSVPVPVAEPVARPTKVLDGLRILLADDNDDLRLAIGLALKMKGASIDFARDGRDAVSKAQSGVYDIVLMDVLMPIMNGIEATRTLRAEGCRLPIIAISADSTPEALVSSAEVGASAHLSKPFGPVELIALIRSLVDGEAAPVSGPSPWFRPMVPPSVTHAALVDGMRPATQIERP